MKKEINLINIPFIQRVELANASIFKISHCLIVGFFDFSKLMSTNSTKVEEMSCEL